MSGEVLSREQTGRTAVLGTLSVKATPDDLRLAVAAIGVALGLGGLVGSVGSVIGLVLSPLDPSDEWHAYYLRTTALGSVGALVSLVFGIWAFRMAKGTSLRGDLAQSVALLISFVGIYLIARGVFGSLGTLSMAVTPHGFILWSGVAAYIFTAAPWLIVGFMMVKISRHRLSYRPKWMKKELVGYQVP